MDDAFDSIFDDDDVEAETDTVVSQVLDEIGIEISGKVGVAKKKKKKKEKKEKHLTRQDVTISESKKKRR